MEGWIAMADVPGDVQRWTAKRRVALVLSIVRGETSVAEAARKHGLTVAEIEEWQERFVAAAENALRSRPKDDEALKDEQIKKLKQKVGELVLDLDILREAAKGRPTDPTTCGEARAPDRGASNVRIPPPVGSAALSRAGPGESQGGVSGFADQGLVCEPASGYPS